jgi:hypothetical protein
MIDWSQLVTAEQQQETDRQALRDQIATRRHEAMCAGISIAGMSVATDDVSQTRFAGAAVSAMLDPDYAVRWKTGDGSFRLLSGAEIIGIATAVRAHVQACYDREADLLAALDAGEPVDPDAGWPG